MLTPRRAQDVAAQLAEGELYEGELRGCFHAVDVDADGQITFSEFLCMLDLLEEAKEKEAAAGGAARSAGSATAVASAASALLSMARLPVAQLASALSPSAQLAWAQLASALPSLALPSPLDHRFLF